MIRSSLRSRCQTRFRDTDAAIYSTTEWNDYIADAEADAYTASPWWPFHEQRNSSFTVTAGTSGAALPTDAIRVNAVYDNDNNYALVPLDDRTSYRVLYPNPSVNLGNPLHYRFLGSTLEVYPRPASDVTLYVDYMVAPTVMSSDSGEPAFPEVYHRMLVSGALAYAYEDDGNVNQAQIHRGRFEQMLDRMMNDLLVSRSESYHVIPDAWD